MFYSINKISLKPNRIGAVLLAIVFLVTSLAPYAEGQWRRHYRRPSKTKNIGVGTAIGAVGGALIGGRKGALIGAGAGAGAGYGVYKYKKNKYKNRRYGYYRR